MRRTALALLLATASCARQKYKGAPPEALHTAILHGGGVEGVDHELKRGAKLKGRDAQSRTALHAAASIGDSASSITRSKRSSKWARSTLGGTLALAAAGGSSDGVAPSSSAIAEAATTCGLSKQRLLPTEAAAVWVQYLASPTRIKKNSRRCARAGCGATAAARRANFHTRLF